MESRTDGARVEELNAPRLPNFLVIGAAKAGTTSLAHALRQHPEIYLSPVKEPRFFAFDGQPPAFRGPDGPAMNRASVWRLDDYRALFAGVRGQHAIGEVSPIYLYQHESVPARIIRTLPGVKLIAILRDPVGRAYSAYLQVVRDGYETLDFAASLACEEGRIAAGWTPLWHFVRRGLYRAQLASYFSQVERRRILVLLYDDLRRDPAGVLREIFRFLDVDPEFRPELSVPFNTGGVARSAFVPAALRAAGRVKPLLPRSLALRAERGAARLRLRNLRPPPALSAEIAERLRARFRPEVLALEQLLDRDLSAWRDPPARSPALDSQTDLS